MDLSNGGMLRASESARRADLVVFNYYLHANAQTLIGERVREDGPWCFWGERPGFHKPVFIGRLVRKRKLAALHASSVPILLLGRFLLQ